MKGDNEFSYIDQLVDLQSDKTPEAIAVRFGTRKISYSELNRRAAKLSQTILSGSGKSSIVGISTTPGIEMIIGLLAILKAGKAYLPLDPVYPKDRLQQIVVDSGIDTCLSAEDEGNFFSSTGVSVIYSDNDTESAPSVKVERSPIACVLYTSGSTGKPKGVCLTHAGLINLLQWQKTQSRLYEGTKTLQFCHLSFDAAFQEIFVPLSTGGMLLIIDDNIRLDAGNLLNFIDQEAINRIFLPFVTLQYLCEAAEVLHRYPSSLEEVISGGEQMKITPQIAGFFTELPDCMLVNGYGPTETSVCVTVFKLKGNVQNWPALPFIGKPVTNVEIFILDNKLKLLAAGNPGEICISGVCLADGYLNRPELTAEKFTEWHHPEKGIIKIYRTGDLAQYLPSGNLEFLGRIDDQIKIRGNRVEPGEIEVTLTQIEGIQQAVVIVREDIPGQKKLIAYLVSSDTDKDTSGIRQALEKQLPDFMIPSAFVWLDDLPKTTSGKVDKKALPKPESKRPELASLYKKPSGNTEQQIVVLWEFLLQLDKVGTDDNFFELGGNSLLAQKTIALLRQQHNYVLLVTKLYQFPTVSGIAAYLDQRIVPANEKRKTSRTAASNSDIAVIGMAGRFPGADTVSELWNILKEGKETIRFFSDQELDPHLPHAIINDPDYVKARGIIENPDQFDAAFFGINPKLAELMDPQQRVFLEISREALESAGYLPQKHTASVGVFAGCGNNTYFLNNVQTQKDLIDKVGSIQVMTLNEKDYIAMRTAYELNLKGPAVSVLSSSSTSLLAIAQAVDSLRKGQCELALAGGVSITVPTRSGHIYQEGSMLSKDGHSRPFDADATGTVFSDGAGVVLLKNIEDAEADGDTIYAIIKGIGLNNDGAGKGSFTAPNAEGQAGAILMAMEDAGADASSISYIETHGTATPLGDPIEIEGLTMAFGPQDKKQFCAIGSIKSNIGHLMHAAGVAGFIKTALSLHYKKLPATLFYKNPNPDIDFQNSPFFVNSVLRDWEAEKTRRAGISSFGVGGTNVHVILEEYTKAHGQLPADTKPQLINWSAKTQKSLDAYALRLTDYVKENPRVSLADLSYTLQSTRQDFNLRRFVVASDVEDLLLKLHNSGETKILTESAADVAFVFPGQGSQFLHMGAGLYTADAAFKEAVDQCAEILNLYLKEDIRSIIYSENKEDKRINNTYYTQPALFVIEYATARLWMSRGIQPAAFTGHSIGEFVAAHLAGIFNLSDALKLVSTRSRLISELPGGSMLAVKANTEKVQELLPDELSIAAVNTPNACVVSGKDDDIRVFSELLDQQGIACMVLNTSHAFHSAMMDPIRESFGSVVKSVDLYPPVIPVVSSVTGKWMTDSEATDPVYWTNQLRLPVLFSEALTTLCEKENRILLEAGAGNVTTGLARQSGKKPFAALSSFLNRENKELEYEDILKTAGQLWLNGITPDWKALHSKKRERLDIPGYVYDRKYCWVEPAVVPGTITLSALPADEKKNIKIVEPELQVIVPMRKATLVEKIKKILEDASGIDIKDTPENMNFIEMGLDSLLLTQIAITLKKEFGLPVTFRQLNEELGNVELLTNFLDANLPAEAFTTPAADQPVQPIAAPGSNLSFDAIMQQLQALTSQVATLQGGNAAQPVIPEVKNTLPATSADEETEIKKPFGASPRIEKQASKLSESQAEFLEVFIKRYTLKTKNSKEYTQRHRPQMADPRVVSGFKPLTKEITYPVVINRSKGSRLWDIDGNEYIDALNGFGSSMLGYQPEILKKAILDQVEKGYEIGPQHELAGDVCKLICEFTGSDRAALCSTGSEAVLGTVRIARTVTGRSLIVAFSGSYHGIFDEVIVRGTRQFRTVPAAAGIMPEAVQNMLILDYGTDESLKIIRERAHELAAVLVEPVQSRRPDFQPVEFLKEVRKITEASGTTLIFDEVITGFRMHPGGAQALFGIKADIASYGKVIGGGLPIGIIAGKKQFMDALDGGSWQFGDSSTPDTGVTYFAGTFVRHPLALATAKASLEYFKTRGPALQEELNSKCRYLTEKLTDICVSLGLPLSVVKFGSLWRFKFEEDIAYSDLLFTLMREKGIHILDGFPCFITEAHTESDLNRMIAAFEESIHDLIGSKFLHPIVKNSSIFVKPNIDMPPVAGARLGRDKDGNPAWFIEDPKQPGKYMQVGTQL